MSRPIDVALLLSSREVPQAVCNTFLAEEIGAFVLCGREMLQLPLLWCHSHTGCMGCLHSPQIHMSILFTYIFMKFGRAYDEYDGSGAICGSRIIDPNVAPNSALRDGKNLMFGIDPIYGFTSWAAPAILPQTSRHSTVSRKLMWGLCSPSPTRKMWMLKSRLG